VVFIFSVPFWNQGCRRDATPLKSFYQRKTIGFDVDSCDQLVREIEALAKARAKIDPKTFIRR